ncbi:ROK family protein [Bacillus sp. HMF5848]|uniref:ROK family protein n=1 Tax=Bacillus sp. HMF5848 TaxID=2495421 RepID=UPI000F7B6126|nr:ROK family protein [Bacillus sp. HMF5848]RSK26150.1 ROK family protein [Bacillus sp. HMF5848]
MMEQVYCGVDIGGTNTKFAVVTQSGNIKYKYEVSTLLDKGGDNLLNMLYTELKTITDEYPIQAVGIGIPTFVHTKLGVVLKYERVNWSQFELSKVIQTKLNIPVTILNDANAAALGEMWTNSGDNSSCNIIFVTLGTSVGGGVVIDGQLHEGSHWMAGELGHMTVEPKHGLVCTCGKTGCLKMYASATAIAAKAINAVKNGVTTILNEYYIKNGNITAKDVSAAALEGDILASDIFAEAGLYLGLALAQLATVFDPQRIVIGGGVSNAGDVLIAPTQASFKEFVLKELAERIRPEISALGNDAGVLGAAWLAKVIR